MNSIMNSDKAYLLGLVIGGGVFGNTEDTFIIKLSLKKWGSYTKNPERSGKIAKDILGFVSPIFRAIYGLNVSYQTSESGTWDVLFEGDLTSLKNDLNHYGISPEGKIKENVSIEKVISELVDDNLKTRFVAGLADTIGSLALSHRRFTNENQIISFEIPGFCFDFVCQVCRLLHSIKCYPDQVEWNHPNLQTGSNPYYKEWNKGSKIRVKLDQYARFGSFAFTTKAEASTKNLQLQDFSVDSKPCKEHELKPRISCIHTDENNLRFPPVIRGGHFIHNRHFCAVLGCEYAPFEKVKHILDNPEKYINPFPIIVKGNAAFIEKIINETALYRDRKYDVKKIKLKNLYKKKMVPFVSGDTNTTGYPLNKVMQGVHYLISTKTGNLRGSRPKGGYKKALEAALSTSPEITFTFKIPDLLTPLIITNQTHSVLIGARVPSVCKKLIKRDTQNPYKIIVRKITEDDLE